MIQEFQKKLNHMFTKNCIRMLIVALFLIARPWKQCKFINSRVNRQTEICLYSGISSVQYSSVAQLCLTLCDPMDYSALGLPVHHQLPKLSQTHVHQVDDAIQSSHLLSSPSPPAFNLSQHQSLFEWVGSSHQVAKVLELQRQPQSFQWIFRDDFL